MIEYSYFVRNVSMPTRFHFFSSTVFFWKKVLFTFIIVILYDMVFVQISLLITLCFLCLCYKLYFNPYNDRYEWSMSCASDFMFICALGCKYNDYVTYREIFLSGNDSLE